MQNTVPTSRRAAIGLVIALVLGGVGGCQTEQMEGTYYTQGHPNQKYSYNEVKKRVKKLQPGMPRSQVMIELGSPAENRGNLWLYHSGQPGFFGSALHVVFQNGVYVSHEYKSIVLGQKER